MPKAKTRRRSGRVAPATIRNTATTSKPPAERARVAPSARPRQKSRAAGIQSVIMPGMVALGCLGMAITFAIFSTDPNRMLFAGLAAIMAVMWSVSFGIRLRKIVQQR